MEELVQQLLEYLRGMWRRRWIGLGVAWVVAIVGAVVLFKMPDKYEASARVYVDTQSMLKPLMSGLAFQPDIDQQVAIISRTLISRPNVEKLIRMTDLDLTAQSPAEKERLIDGLTRQLKLRGSARENIYTISYQRPGSGAGAAGRAGAAVDLHGSRASATSARVPTPRGASSRSRSGPTRRSSKRRRTG